MTHTAGRDVHMESEYIKEYQGYQIKPHKQHPKSYIIVTMGKGGKIPNVMEGLFTDRHTAMRVIDSYLSSKPKKENKDNAETGSAS